MKKIIKVLLSIVLSIVLLLALVFLFASISPYPTAWAVRALFSTTSYTDHENLSLVKENITINENIKYDSTYKNNTLDIIYKSEYDLPMPVIFWIHGGAFVAGDKKDVTNYMIMLANEGYVIININYELAPRAKYPAPIIQVGEAYEFIIYSNDYPFIDKDSIYFGTDSAGVHIASQFILKETNQEYLSLLNTIDVTKDLKKVVNKEIKGAILFAGPYDFNALSMLVKSRTEKMKIKH